MDRKRKNRNMSGGSRIITIVSVAMVLLVLGLTMELGIGARNAARLIRSEMGFVAVVDPSAGQASVDSLTEYLREAPYVSRVETHTADEVLARWEELMGPEDLLDINPFLPEYEVTLKPAWARHDSIENIVSVVERFGCVDHLQTHSEVAAGVSHSVSSVMLVLAIAGLTLLLISGALVANMVRLQLYSQRYVIHTQQYVGATAGYVVRPYMRRAAGDGLIAAVAAAVALWGVTYYAAAIDPLAAALVDWWSLAGIAAAMALLGAILCAATAGLTARRYVERSYDDIFR